MPVNKIVTLDKSVNIADFGFLIIYKTGPHSSSETLKNACIFKIHTYGYPHTLWIRKTVPCVIGRYSLVDWKPSNTYKATKWGKRKSG